MKILKRIIYFVLGVLILVLLTALFVKKDYKVEQEVVINKPLNEVFAFVKMLKNQETYSVWAMKDPAMKKTYTGTDGTAGFISAWDSENKDVGKGEQEIKAVSEGEKIEYELRFEKPFKATNTAYMSTQSEGENRTLVKWAFEGSMPYPMNIMLLFVDMKSMIGKDLQSGLDKLKSNMEM